MLSISFDDSPESIKNPNKIGDKEVEKTIKETVIDLMAPICFVPYISDQVEVIKTFAVPFVIAIKEKNNTGDNANLKRIEKIRPIIIGTK